MAHQPRNLEGPQCVRNTTKIWFAFFYQHSCVYIFNKKENCLQLKILQDLRRHGKNFVHKEFVPEPISNLRYEFSFMFVQYQYRQQIKTEEE